mmetsp:Transcript_46278/g.108111  ORF Transcript_46278/g.108111 Transcript_46278/m.108111 type:complete len:245 (-) Transcript_46278:141-875(-)
MIRRALYEGCAPNIMVRTGLLVLSAALHCNLSLGKMMIRRALYEDSLCSGAPYMEEFLLSGCMDDGFVEMVCNGTGVSASLHENEDCAGNATSSQFTLFDTCNNKQKLLSCIDMEGYVVASYNMSGCDDQELLVQHILPAGCRATGKMEDGEIVTESQHVELINRNLVVKTYAGSSYCAGNHSETRVVELPCGAVCVDGNAHNGLTNDTWYAYRGSCRAGVSGTTISVRLPGWSFLAFLFLICH